MELIYSTIAFDENVGPFAYSRKEILVSLSEISSGPPSFVKVTFHCNYNSVRYDDKES